MHISNSTICMRRYTRIVDEYVQPFPLQFGLHCPDCILHALRVGNVAFDPVNPVGLLAEFL
jgi:hypothetical protein